MKRSITNLLLLCALLVPAFAQQGNPFIGRWDFTVTAGNSVRPSWLGVKQGPAGLEVWYQPPTANVYQVKDFKISGSHMTVTISPAAENRPAQVWELDAAGGKLTGVQQRGQTTIKLVGVRAPELKRNSPAAWTNPEPLFNGKDLTGWEPLPGGQSRWIVRNGELVNEAHGANLKTTRTFDDFKLHIDANCPDKANSGIFLRGRYEVQLEYEPLSANPPERRIGSIYGRITPADAPRTPGKWETFDITLVGRTVTVVRNGITTIDHKEIEGLTGGALDPNEGEPGPIYIQGDHTGGLRFRNITISVPRK